MSTIAPVAEPIAPVVEPAVAPITRRVNGELRLTYPTRGYAVTRNPFAIWSVLPVITLAFAGLAISVTVMSDPIQLLTALGAFAVVALGMLLVPAVALKGSLNLTHDGVTFERGKHHLTAGWSEMAGLVWRRDAGLCLLIRGQDQTKANWTLPGGFRAANGVAQIPLRFFGDRQFSILYDIRDRLPAEAWKTALEQAERSSRSTRQCELAYAGVVVIAGIALFSSYLSVTP
jgi:hypothetical protein